MCGFAAPAVDYGRLGTVLAEHYAGDDTNVRTLLGGVLAAFAGITVEDFEKRSDGFLRTARPPTLGRSYLRCAYAPMIELLAYLEGNGFPRERVIGSATALEYVSSEHGGTIIRRPEADYLDDGPQKPIRIWSRVGRRPLLAAGNSNGGIPMLDFTQHQNKPYLRLLLLHDDADREFDYTAGAEQALERADTHAWTVISVKHDWATVFPGDQA